MGSTVYVLATTVMYDYYSKTNCDVFIAKILSTLIVQSAYIFQWSLTLHISIRKAMILHISLLSVA